jgi:hypothetical protein
MDYIHVLKMYQQFNFFLNLYNTIYASVEPQYIHVDQGFKILIRAIRFIWQITKIL